MALREQVVELVLRAKNLLSRDAENAADSVRDFSGSAEDLNQRLRDLEDQKGLITQFQRASKAVDRTGAAYERAQVKLANLEDKIEQTGTATAKQTRELELARSTVARTSRAYDDATDNLNGLSKEADDAGIELGDLNEAQRENARETTAAKRALEDYNQNLGEGGSRLQRLGQTLKTGAVRLTAWATAAAAATAALAVGGITRFTRDSAELARTLSNTSIQLGISTTRLQELSAASRTVNIDQDKLIDILKDMREKLGDAANGGGQLAEELQRIGLDVQDLIGLSPDEQLLRIADAIQALPSEQQVTVLEAMASDASRLIPLLKNGADGINALGRAATQRGAILSPEEIENLLKVQAALDRIRERFTGLRNQIVSAVAPTFEELAVAIDEAFDEEAVKDFQTTIEGLSQRLIGFVRDFAGDIGSISERIQPLVDTLQFLSNTGVAVFRTLQAGVATFVASVSGGVTALSAAVTAILSSLNKIGLATDESVERARANTEALRQTTGDLVDKATEYGRAAREAAGRAATAFNNAKGAADEVAASTEKAAESVGQISEAIRFAVGEFQELVAAGRSTESALRSIFDGFDLGIEQDVTNLVDTLAELERQGLASSDAIGEELSRAIRGLTADDLTAFAAAAEGAFADGSLGASSLAEVIRTTVTDALNQLKQKAEEAGDGIADVGTNAVDDFRKVRFEILKSGDSAELAGDKIVAAFVAAFEKVKTEAGRKKLLAELQKVLDEGTISALQFNEALKLVGAEEGSEKVNQLTERIRKLKTELKDAGDEGEEVGDKVEAGATKGGSSMELIATAIGGFKAELRELSAAAEQAFDQLALGIEPAGDEAERTRDRIRSLNLEIEEIRKQSLRVADFSGLQGVLMGLRETAREVEITFLEQKQAAQQLFQTFDDGRISYDRFIQKAERMIETSELLDDEDLSNLRRGIDQASAAMDRLNESSDRTLANLQTKLDRLRGDTEAAERRQFEQEIAELEAQLETARRQRNDEAVADLKESLRVAKEIFEVEKQQRAEAERERAQRDRQDNARQQDQDTPQPPPPQRAPAPPPREPARRDAPIPGRSARTVNLNLSVEGSRLGSLSNLDPREVDALVRAIQNSQFFSSDTRQ